MGLARRASRKLVPVVLTLGSGPSGFPRKLSGRRPKLPRQPRRGRVARARFRNFGAGSWPVGSYRNNFPGDGRRFRDSRGKSAPSHARAPLFWRWGLARRASPGDGQSSATASLALASVVLALGGGRTGFPKQVSERCKARGSWTPTAMANPRRRTCALRYFGARVWPVGLPETIFRAKLPRQPWQTRAVARARSVILALGGWPDGLPETSFRAMQSGGSWRPPRHTRPEAYVATRAAQIIKGEGQASGNGRSINQKRTNGQISCFGLRMADFILSRIRSLSAARPSHFYQGLAKRMATLSRPASRSGRFIKADGRFIKFYQQRFHIAPYKEFISGQAEPFLSSLAKRLAVL